MGGYSVKHSNHLHKGPSQQFSNFSELSIYLYTNYTVSGKCDKQIIKNLFQIKTQNKSSEDIKTIPTEFIKWGPGKARE